MMHRRVCLISLGWLLLVGVVLVFAVEVEANDFRMMQEEAPTGSRIRQDAVVGKLPFNRTWDRLTEEQRAIVRSRYIDLAEDEEPPFPLRGKREMMREISKAQNVLLTHGYLFAIAMVDAEGDVKKVDFYAVPEDDRMTQFVAHVLIATKFKPALCAGEPCEMEYSLRMDFR